MLPPKYCGVEQELIENVAIQHFGVMAWKRSRTFPTCTNLNLKFYSVTCSCEVMLQALILQLSEQIPMHVEAQTVFAGTPEGWRQLFIQTS